MAGYAGRSKAPQPEIGRSIPGCCAAPIKSGRRPDPSTKWGCKWGCSRPSASCEFTRSGHLGVQSGFMGTSSATHNTEEHSKDSRPLDSSFAPSSQEVYATRSAAPKNRMGRLGSERWMGCLVGWRGRPHDTRDRYSTRYRHPPSGCL